MTQLRRLLIHPMTFGVLGILRDSVTNGTCFHVVPLFETSVNTVAVSLEHLMGKVIFIDLTSMPGIVFAAHFPNTIEKF